MSFLSQMEGTLVVYYLFGDIVLIGDHCKVGTPLVGDFKGEEPLLAGNGGVDG